MDRLRIFVCEDEEQQREALSALLDNSPVPVIFEIFPDGEALLAVYYAGCCDLVLMDIFMGEMSGVDAVARIRAVDPEVPIAFLTTSRDFALEGYQYHVDRYLLKPVKPGDLEEVLRLAARRKNEKPSVTLSIQGRSVRVIQDMICHAEQEAHSVRIHLADGTVLQAVMKLSDLAAMLPTPPFYQCHKSFLINFRHVKYLDNSLKAFVMSDGKNAYIRRNSLREAQDVYSRFMFGQMRGKDEK